MTEMLISGSRFDVLGRLAVGEFCDTFLARGRDPEEMVVVKALRDRGDEKSFLALGKEIRFLDLLLSSDAKGSDFFRYMVPQPVIRATRDNLVWTDGRSSVTTTANVFRWRPGFVYTYEDLRQAYPDGVPATAGVWLANRVLETLGWVHNSGYAHASLTPQHMLVHPREHAVVLVGWSRVVPLGTALRARSTEYKQYYPQDVWDGGVVTRASDVAMAMRSLFYVLGGDTVTGALPDTVPEPLANLVYNNSRPVPATTDAWDLQKQFKATAVKVFGPAKYIPFEVPAPLGV